MKNGCSYGNIAKNATPMTKFSRDKGASFERKIAAQFREVYPEARRGVAQVYGGDKAPDVEGAGPWWIECKAGKRPNIGGALGQAIRNAGGTGKIPVAVCHVDHSATTATLLFEDFLKLIKNSSRGLCLARGRKRF